MKKIYAIENVKTIDEKNFSSEIFVDTELQNGEIMDIQVNLSKIIFI